MFNARLMQSSIDNYNAAVERYEKIANHLAVNTNILYQERERGLELVKLVEDRINQMANSPKEFVVILREVDIEVTSFRTKQEEVRKAEIEARKAAGVAGAGATLGALGLAVATMGPTAAMGIATTFGVASTGTAISALTGAAATNAALAWLGGGALAVGGGGISAGTAFLALAGPVGWTIAGVMLTGTVGSSLYYNRKNKKNAKELIAERMKLEEVIRKFDSMNAEINALMITTNTQIRGVIEADKALAGNDYNDFSNREKKQAGLLVNSTLTLAQLINKELNLDD